MLFSNVFKKVSRSLTSMVALLISVEFLFSFVVFPLCLSIRQMQTFSGSLHAQITIDSSRHATGASHSPSHSKNAGVDVLNIGATDASGVSRNYFRDYNVR